MSSTSTREWEQSLNANAAVIARNGGPGFVSIVSGSERDRSFWQRRAEGLARDLFRSDGAVIVQSVVEAVPKGNFLGSLVAWSNVQDAVDHATTGLMTMVFGEGRRLSPFTQALGNRKPALPTPAASSIPAVYLNAAELAMRHTALPVDSLQRGGFRGLLIKWGDEALIPEHTWKDRDLTDVDAIRFVSLQEPNETTAREKEWLVIDPETHEVVAELPRQDPKTLLERIAAARQQGFDVGVNLGSLGASYDLLQTSHRVLRDLLPSAHRLDWDPFVWMALLCRTDAEWERQTDLSGASGQALQRLLAELPDFYQRIRGVREAHESIVGRPLRVVAYDFGHPLWVDFGLHVPARRALLALVGEPDEAAVARRLFGVSHPDSEGNTILRSTVAADARITNSVIIDSAIGAGSVVNRAVIVGSQVERLELPHGGAVLFSHAAAVHGGGSNAIVFGWRGETLQIAEGDRVALVASPNGSVEMRSNESLAQYAGPTFDLPVLGNPVSFAQAAALAAEHGATYFERDI